MKDKILNAAIETLTVKGIHHTTIRDIAKALKISDGHLRYYFKTKEELILYVFRSLEEELSRYAAEGMGFQGIASIRNTLYVSFRLMIRYAFFFMETPYSLSAFPEVKAAWKSLFEQRKQLFMVIFAQNKQNGIFRKDIPDRRYELLSEQFFIIAENWIKHSRSYDTDTPGEKEIAHIMDITMALFLPYFTPGYAKEAEAGLERG